MKTTQRATIDLWSLVKGNPSIDPEDLLDAVDAELEVGLADFRSRLLMRESLMALRDEWGLDQMMARLSSGSRTHAQMLLEKDPGEIGFPTLRSRMHPRTDSKTILAFLRELGSECDQPAKIEIGGSSALILSKLLRRGTEDIDVVNEVPGSVRTKHDLLNRLALNYGLMLTHFQSHYLPGGFENRLHYFDRFRVLDVYLVDALDIFVGKLCSRREKDINDLRMLEPHFKRDEIVDRIKSSAKPLFTESKFRSNAEKNWYILFGESLPA